MPLNWKVISDTLLNLLPYTWTKYVGFILMISPFALYAMDAKWSKYKASLKSEIPIGFEADGKPWFQDAQKQTLAIAIFKGEADKVKQLLQGPQGRMLLEKGNEEQTILEFALSQVIFSSSQLEEKFVCVKALFEAGIKLGADADPDYFITAAADAGSAALVQLLLEQGADARFVLSDGLTVESMIREQSDDYQGDSYSTADDLKQLKKQLGL